ncbi:MAG: hypothetical protein P4L64_03865 [Caulobacteraceae bacterium]|nr:hypothetical protein [Caulobacteraceae bacterium]
MERSYTPHFTEIPHFGNQTAGSQSNRSMRALSQSTTLPPSAVASEINPTTFTMA